MIISLSAEAEADLEAIGDFIARENPERALTFLQELHSKCMSLAEFPKRFPLVPRYADRGIRRRSHGNYLIFYQVNANEVLIIHILNGTQDYAAVLDPM